MDDGLNDIEVIKASINKPEAFGVIFDRHFPVVFGFLARRLGEDVASDLAAEVFTVAFKHRHRFRPDRSTAGPWLIGIAANLVLKHGRSERRRLRAFAREHGQRVLVAEPYEAVDERLAASEEHQRVMNGLADLRDVDRAVVLLLAWEGMSYEAAAEVLQVPLGTVKSRMNRARRSLRLLNEQSSQEKDRPDHPREGAIS